MAQAAPRPATTADLERVPPHRVAEIVDGVLETHRRPGPAQSEAQFRLVAELGNAFVRTRTGPGGWIVLPEPELHLGARVVVPNLAGWRRERGASSPDAIALTGGRWLLPGTAIGGEEVSLPPFDAITFPLDDLFPFADPAASAPPET